MHPHITDIAMSIVLGEWTLRVKFVVGEWTLRVTLFLPLRWGAGPMALMLWLNLVI
jgi:hypothetical protein